MTRLNCKPFLCFFLLTAFLVNAVPAMGQDEDNKPWTIGASLGLEYDDNLTRIEQDIVSGDSDHAYIFELNGSYRFLDTSDLQLEAGYDFFQSIYDDRSDFDFQSHGFNLGAAHEEEKFDLSADINYTTANLDDLNFVDLFMFIPRVGISLSPALYTDISYMFQDKNFDTDNRRDASNHSISLSQFLFFMESKAYVSGTYRLESEDADGAEFDYVGHLLKAALKYPAPFETIFKASLQFKFRDYDNITPSIGEERDDTITTFKLELAKKLSRLFDVRASYEHIDSESNLATVDFSENILYLVLAFQY